MAAQSNYTTEELRRVAGAILRANRYTSSKAVFTDYDDESSIAVWLTDTSPVGVYGRPGVLVRLETETQAGDIAQDWKLSDTGEIRTLARALADIADAVDAAKEELCQDKT